MSFFLNSCVKQTKILKMESDSVFNLVKKTEDFFRWFNSQISWQILEEIFHEERFNISGQNYFVLKLEKECFGKKLDFWFSLDDANQKRICQYYSKNVKS
jgi:hypothetical protein